MGRGGIGIWDVLRMLIRTGTLRNYCITALITRMGGVNLIAWVKGRSLLMPPQSMRESVSNRLHSVSLG